MNLTTKEWMDFLKEVGWDDPKYGWTKEKEAVRQLLLRQIDEDNKRFLEYVGEDEGSKEFNIPSIYRRPNGYIPFSIMPTIYVTSSQKARNELRAELRDKVNKNENKSCLKQVIINGKDNKLTK